MKKKISTLMLILFGITTFAQTLYFNNKRLSLKYVDAQGKTQFKYEETVRGNFKLVFEIGTDGTPLYTMYDNGKEQYWAGESRNFGWKEIGGILFKHTWHYDTSGKEVFDLYVSKDNKRVTLVRKEYLIEYY